jgi:hypothetical protein
MNFPINPTLNQTYTYGSKTWKWDGTVWNLQIAGVAQAVVAQVEQEAQVAVVQVDLMLLEFLDHQTRGAVEVAMEAHQPPAATAVLES